MAIPRRLPRFGKADEDIIFLLCITQQKAAQNALNRGNGRFLTFSRPAEKVDDVKNKGQKMHRSVLVRIAFLAFAVYAVVTLTGDQIELVSSMRKLSELHAEVDRKKMSNEELQRLYDTGTDKDFIERAARDKLGYVYSDEQVFVDIGGE